MKRFSDESHVHRHLAIEMMEDRLVLSANPFDRIDVVVADQAVASFYDTAYESTGNASNPELTTMAKLVDIGADSVKKYDEMTGLSEVKDLYGLDGSGQTVVIIDSGIAYDHIALGEGFGEGYRVVGGYDFADNDADPYDSGPRGSHGTHVAGIIASESSKYPGVATGVDLVSLRIFSDDGTSDMQYLIDALEWVYNNLDSFENPVTTINLSVGYVQDSNGYFDQINEWFRLLSEEGVFISVAAGNSFQSTTNQNQLSYPAMSEYVVSVGAVGASGDVAYFSQRDANTIMAPGQHIKSTVPDYVGNGNGIDDDYSTFSGTSMAAPYVAGASTLIRQAMQLVGMTDITQQMIYDVIVATADKVYDAVTGQIFSRINILNAIESILPGDEFGDTIADATGIGSVVDTQDINGFFNAKTDNDYFSYVADKTGTIVITPEMSTGLTGKWDLGTLPGAVIGDDGAIRFDVVAGQTYAFGFNASGKVGAYTLGVKYIGSSDNKPGDEIGNESDNKPGGEIGNESDSKPGGEIGNESDNKPGGETGNESNNKPGDEIGNESDNKPSGEIGSESDNKPGGETGNESDNKPGDEIGNESDNKPGGDLNESGNTNHNDDDTAPSDTVAVTVDQATIENQRLTEIGSWYAVTATNTGTMTFELMLPEGVAAGNVVIEMGDDDGNVTATYTGTSRIDFNMTAGTTAWVRVATTSGMGTIDGVSIRLTNLLRQEGTQIFVVGTNGNDDIAFEAGTTHSLIINGVMYTFDGNQVSNVNIDSRGGNDTVRLTGTNAADYITIDGTDTTMTGGNYQIAVRNAEYLVIDGNGGNDTLRYYDTVGSDLVTVRTGEITIASERFFAQVDGMSRFFAYSNKGGNDSAVLYDSPGNDTLNVSATYTLFKSGMTTSQLYAFESLVAHSVNGGNDTATITDTNSASTFVGSAESVKRYSDNQFVEARGFAQVDLTSLYGGTGTVRLEDSAGNDTLYISSGGVSLNGEHYSISVRGFDFVHTSSVNGGDDKVMIYDTHKAQKITASRNMINIIDSLYSFEADGFAEVWAFGHRSESSKIVQNNTDYVLNLLGLWGEN